MSFGKDCLLATSLSWLNCSNSSYTSPGDDGKRGSFARAQGKLAEDKGSTCHRPSQSGSQPSGSRGCGIWRVCVPRLPHPFVNSSPAPPLTSSGELSSWKSRDSITAKLKLYIHLHPTYLYGSECWAVTKVDAVDEWCLRTLLGLHWHQFVHNDEVRRLTKQPDLTVIIQSRRLSVFGHIACMDDDADAEMILTPPPLLRTTRSPRITWFNTIQRDLRTHNLTLNEAVDLTQNGPLWRQWRHLFRYVTNQPPKTNSAFHPSEVGKWVQASARKAKAGMAHSVSGWTRGVQIKLWDRLPYPSTLEVCSRRGAIQIHVYLTLPRVYGATHC